MFIAIIDWVRKAFNNILFKELENITNFSPVHIKLMLCMLAFGIVITLIYRFFVYKKKTRNAYLKGVYITIACLLLFFLVYTETYKSNYERNFLELNFVHLIYTFIPLGLRYLCFILIGIVVFSKKEHPLIGNFTLAISPFVGLITTISIDDFIIRDSYFLYFALNYVLIFFPIMLAVFKKIKPNLKHYVLSYIVLFGVLIISLCFNYTFEAIMPHSQRYQIYNYNYTIMPCSQLVRGVDMRYANVILLPFYNLIPVPFLYLIIPIILMILVNTFILLLVNGKQKLKEDLIKLFTHPIKFLFKREQKYEVIG